MRRLLLKFGWRCFRTWLKIIGERYDFVIRKGELYRQQFSIEGEITRQDGTVENLGEVKMRSW